MIEATTQNNTILERFAVLMKNKRLAHAYLFVGPQGVGKFETARDVAKLVLCQTGSSHEKSFACGSCPSCIKVEKGNHPDIFCLNSQYGETIKIEEVRALISWMQLRPFEAEKKVIVIRNIENLTLAGANAILKTLEEPGANNLMLLTTSVPERILETVKSRCHAMYLYPLSPQRLANHLQKTFHLDEEAAHFLAFFSEGSVGRAENLKEEKIYVTKNKVIDYFMSARSDDAYMKKMLADKAKTKEVLDILISWVRDILLLKAGGEERSLVHGDRIQNLQMMAQRTSFQDLKEMLREIVRTTQLLNDNLNVKIALNLIKEKMQAI